jgi:hypothetical protein
MILVAKEFCYKIPVHTLETVIAYQPILEHMQKQLQLTERFLYIHYNGNGDNSSKDSGTYTGNGGDKSISQ